jgi:hypothetical protein
MILANREILSSFPHGALSTPEMWRAATRPHLDGHGAEILFGDREERFLDEEVALAPEVDAAYDEAIDAAFAKVMDLVCGPAGEQ